MAKQAQTHPCNSRLPLNCLSSRNHAKAVLGSRGLSAVFQALHTYPLT